MSSRTALALSLALLATPLLAATPRTAGPVVRDPPAATRAADEASAAATERDAPPREGVESGRIAYYGPRFHGRRTASGERFDANALTMAHPTLPFGTRVRVTNPENGHSVVVRVNDRGPFGGHRIGDVSLAAAKRLGMVKRGVIEATLEVVTANSG